MAGRTLQRIYAASLTEPATWGARSCLHFAADLSLAQTGVDPISQIRGKFRTKREALSLERTFGRDRKNAAQSLADFCGWISVSPILADLGAMGLVRVDRKLIAACFTPDGWAYRTRQGFCIVRSAAFAWNTHKKGSQDYVAFGHRYGPAPAACK